MDFSSHNPETSNPLNLAARNNDALLVQQLLKKINPNIADNRGWTCLHEAAFHDCYESLQVILKNPECRPLIETHEGHTALYLACRNQASPQTVKYLLENVEDIANYGSTESVTPLHVVSGQGNLEIMQLLIEHGALIDVQDYDGDTPLHDAVLETKFEAVSLLLHAGASPEIPNEPGSFTPFHLACSKGCFETMKAIYPFVTDINQVTSSGKTALMLALTGANEEIVDFLLENGIDPHIRDINGDLALDIALTDGYHAHYKKIFNVTKLHQISLNTILKACKPHYCKMDILEILLSSDLGPEYFDFIEIFHVMLEKIGDIRPYYRTNAVLNSYLNICEYIYNRSREKFYEFFYLFLMRGVSVNALEFYECPPLVYIHYCLHINSFSEAFQIMIDHGCNVDYCSVPECYYKDKCIPDAFIASLTSDALTLPYMIPYSLHVDPDSILQFAEDSGVSGRINSQVQITLVTMAGYDPSVTSETLAFHVAPLKHITRCRIRSLIRNRKGGVKSTKEFFKILEAMPLPTSMKNYLSYH
ncbi:ankyrin repeat and SOCS box protein 3 isoform X1 [Bombyx mori]|uniref:SOCS box domain-containing protein n=1 Tax=Bombyx mori TaxID=7091 RepID=A0A8R2C6V2_BOMMO|nr:ankyrin repeat and SOCS box protein 3 [Bombyx mori]